MSEIIWKKRCLEKYKQYEIHFSQLYIIKTQLAEILYTWKVIESGSQIAKIRNTKNIRYSQNDIRGTFENGASVNELVYLKKIAPICIEYRAYKACKNNDLPSEVQKYLSKQGVSSSVVFSLDNRRLYAEKQAGVKVNSVWATQADLNDIDLVKRFSTVTGGETIEIC